MSFIAVIPSRYASTRLPGKPLADLNGQPLISHVVARANESQAERVIVATDDQRIADALDDSAEVCMTAVDHPSGSDRLAEVMKLLDIHDDTIVVNIQGDEPLIPPALINQVATALKQNPQAAMATAAHPIDTEEDRNDPNVVKVVFTKAGQALYFSRSPIPHGAGAVAWHHIGIYAYRAEFLKRYKDLSVSELEQSESLEQLRVMDNGEIIMVERVDYDAGIGVDTPEDLERVRAILADRENARND